MASGNPLGQRDMDEGEDAPKRSKSQAVPSSGEVSERSALIRRAKSTRQRGSHVYTGQYCPLRFGEIDSLCPKAVAIKNAMRVGGANVIAENDYTLSLVKYLGHKLEDKREAKTGPKKPEFGDLEDGTSSAASVDDLPVPAVVPYIYVTAFAIMIMQTSVAPMILLYTNYRGWTSEVDIGFYAAISLVMVAVPIVGNVAAGAWAAATSPGHALRGIMAAVCIGSFFMVVADSAIVFIFGYTLFSLNLSVRIVRVTILAEVVPNKLKTTIMAKHSLATPVGALFGPLVWMLCSQYSGNVDLFTLLPGFIAFRLNRFTMAMSFALLAGLLTLMLVQSNKFDRSSEASGGTRPTHRSMNSRVTFAISGQEDDVLLSRFRFLVFRWFSIVMFMINFSVGFFQIGFQPLLIDYFRLSDSYVGAVYELISALAVIPPLLVTVLSRYLADRQLMLVGVICKLIGMLLYCVPFGPRMYPWQLVLGFILIIKASIFFFTSALSLFTKILGPINDGTLIGVLSSISAAGPALAQLLALNLVLKLYGTWWYLWSMTGMVIGIGMIIQPWYWTRLDSERPWLKELHRAISNEPGKPK